MSISKWLDKVAVQQHQIERKARKGDFEDKADDESFYTLLDLYEKGYDRVTWVATDDEKTCKLCNFYSDHETTWRLHDFLHLAKTSSYRSELSITAARPVPSGPWADLDDSDKLWVLRTPNTAYNYVLRTDNFTDVPEDVLKKISESVLVSEIFAEVFMESEDTEELPKIIIDTIARDATWVDWFHRNYKNKGNFPKQLVFKGMDESEDASYINEVRPLDYNTSLLQHEAPIFEHSHVGCRCQLKVWKSDNPSDVVYVDATTAL